MAFAQFIAVKASFLKDLVERLDRDHFFCDNAPLKAFFDKELKDTAATHRYRKEKRSTSQTAHQTRVGQCMRIVSTRFPHTKGSLRMGIAARMSKHLKEHGCTKLDETTLNKDLLDKAINAAIVHMTKKHGEAATLLNINHPHEPEKAVVETESGESEEDMCDLASESDDDD